MSKPDRWALALCAPERETDATVALFRAGERVAEIRPDRLLAGSSDVILVSPPVFELPPFEYAPLRHSRAYDRLASTPSSRRSLFTPGPGGCCTGRRPRGRSR